MNNYQLYRTNVLLGGQMKYDLILSSGPNHTYIKDIHISPISNNAPYSKHIDNDILNYSHSENIKNFYKKIENYFYNDFANPILSNIYPLTENYTGEIEETTYEMGCRRMKYHLYNKQFEFLCPVWLEQIDDIKDLKFRLNIYTGDKNLLISRDIEFDQDKMINYFNNFIKQLGLDKGCDWVFDISENKSVLTGLNVSTGQCENKELLRLYKDLISIERPVLEFNNIIINTINSNHMIAKQLFNFNLCFNFEDILNTFLFKELDNHHISVSIDVLIKDQPLTYKDIFSNHTNIIRNFLEIPQLRRYNDGLDVSDTYDEATWGSTNVFDYMKDYDCVDLVDKNKIMQNTCHWCYSSEPENSTFNMYDGFSLLHKNKFDELIDIPYYNGKIPNLQVVDPDAANYPFWCNNYIAHSISLSSSAGENNLKDILPHLLNKEDHLFSEFSSNCVVKGINYKTRKKYKPILVTVLHYSNYNTKGLENDVIPILNQYPGWGFGYLKGGSMPKNKTSDVNEWDIMFILPYNNFNDRKIIFICPTVVEQYCCDCGKIWYNYNQEVGCTCTVPFVGRAIYKLSNYKNMFYRNFVKELSKFSPEDAQPSEFIESPEILKEFYDIIKSPNPYYNHTIHFNTTLAGIHANSPSLSSKEIYYYKKKTDKIIIRNLGKIKPYFISENGLYYNQRYSKKYLEEIKDVYQQYSNTCYGPKYPSLNYFSLNHNKETYDINKVEVKNNIEYHYYKHNRIFNLQPTMTFKCIMEDEDVYKKIGEQIEEIYGEALHNEFKEEEIYKANLKYLTDQYKLVHTNIEYEDGKFIYEMQIKLK